MSSSEPTVETFANLVYENGQLMPASWMAGIDFGHPDQPSYTVIHTQNPMREITTHIVNPANDKITIEVRDQPGSGGAHHLYAIRGMNYDNNPSAAMAGCVGAVNGTDILFQNGPINENGVNGITQEVLLAIVQDRLECFQAGPYACADNAEALEHIKAAQEVLQRRTKARMARGVEGTHTV